MHVLSAPPAFVLSQDQTLHRVQTALLEQTLLRLFGIRVDSFPVRRHTAGHDACLPAPEGRRATGRPVQALLMTLIVKQPRVSDPLPWRPSGVTRSVASAQPSSVEQVLQSNPVRPLRQPLGESSFLDFRRAGVAVNSFKLNHLDRSVKGRNQMFCPPSPQCRRSGDSLTT